MKAFTLFFLLLAPFVTSAQSTDSLYLQEMSAYQQKLNKEYADPAESPLEPEDLKDFKELPFFPVNEKYRINARFVRTPGSKAFKMPTFTSRKPVYEKFGEAHFELDGEKIVLAIYQSHDLRQKEEYKNHLFLPFKDLTNGRESYGGGRYLDLNIPERK